MKKSAPPTFELYPVEGAGGQQLLQLVAPGHVRSSSCRALNQAELTDGGYIRNVQNRKEQLGFYHRLNPCYCDISWPPILCRLCRFSTSTTSDDVGIATLKQEIIYSYSKVNIIRIMDQRVP